MQIPDPKFSVGQVVCYNRTSSQPIFQRVMTRRWSEVNGWRYSLESIGLEGITSDVKESYLSALTRLEARGADAILREEAQ